MIEPPCPEQKYWQAPPATCWDKVLHSIPELKINNNNLKHNNICASGVGEHFLFRSEEVVLKDSESFSPS